MLDIAGSRRVTDAFSNVKLDNFNHIPSIGAGQRRTMKRSSLTLPNA